jgi:hypothetical protein
LVTLIGSNHGKVIEKTFSGKDRGVLGIVPLGMRITWEPVEKHPENGLSAYLSVFRN